MPGDAGEGALVVAGFPVHVVKEEPFRLRSATYQASDESIAYSCQVDFGDGTDPVILEPCLPGALERAWHEYLEVGDYPIRIQVSPTQGSGAGHWSSAMTPARVRAGG
jgi:hypothetical protein